MPCLQHGIRTRQKIHVFERPSVHYEMMVRTQFFTFMVHSTMAESVGKTVGLSVIPFDIHIMHKSAEAEA